MAILRNDTVVKSADGQHSSAIITAANIGSHSIAPNSTYFIGTTQNVFNRASGAQTLTGVSIDGNAATVTNGVYTTGTQTIGGDKTFSSALNLSTGGTSARMFSFYTNLTNTDDWTNSAVSIRERDLVGIAQSANTYSPNLNFHWGSRVSNSLWMDSNGNLAWGSYSETGVPSSDGAFYANNLYASIYFDKNNTAYYLDPANTGTSLLVAGSVGISKTSLRSGSVLDVNGYGCFGASAYGFYIGTDATGAFLDAGSQLIRMFAGSSEKLRIQADGNVGIGTTSPAYKLDVNGSIALSGYRFADFNTYYTRIFEPSGNTAIYLGNASDPTNYSDNTNHAFRNRGGSSVYAYINSSGNIGIGTTSPAYKLDVSGAINASTYVYAGVFYDNDNTVYYTNPSGTSNLVGLTVANTITGSISGNAATVTNGVYTTGAQTIGGAKTFSDGIIVNGATYYTFNKPTTANYQTVALFGSASAGLFLTTDSAIIGVGAYYNNGWIATATSGRQIDFAGGNFTFGAFSGATVGGAASWGTVAQLSSAGVFSATGDFRAPIFYDSNNTSYYLDAANSGTSMLVAGKVGIGTTSPGYTLTVNGTIAYTPSAGNPVFIGNDATYGTSGTGRYVTLGFGGLANSANKIFAHNMGEDGLYICSATSRSIFFRAGGGATDHVVITSGGNLGVATLSADTNLQVVGHVHVGNQTTFENAGGWNKTIYLDGLVHARMRILGSAYASGKNSATETNIWVDNSVAPYSGLTTNAGSFTINAGFTTLTNNARSPIFYDSDNTAYYIDAASTSVLNALTVGGEPVLTQANITFTPNGVGWYRILTAGGISSGTIRISGFYDNRSATVEFDYTVNGWGNQCYVTVRNNNNYSVGLITEIRVSNDGGASANSYLDIYIASSTTPAALTISNFGPIKGTLVSSPVVGAVAGTSNIKTVNISNIMGLVTTGVVNGSAATFSGSVTSTYGNFSSPGLIMGDAQYGFYVSGGNVYYKSASGGVHYWRNIANSANTMSLDNSGNILLSGYINASSYIYTATYLQTGGNLIYPSGYGATQRLEVSNSANNSWIDGLTIAPGGTVTAPDNMRSPIFYDSNDTNYYGDFAGTSRLNILNLINYAYINGQTLNGQSFYQWEGATFRNPADHTPQLLIRKDNSTTGINGFAPALALYNNNGSDQTTVGMAFVSAEAVSPTQGNSVELAGIIAKKESSGTAGAWSQGSLNFFVKDFGTRRDVMSMSSNGVVTAFTDIRSPIFYDSNNTTYYCDPSSTSNLVGLTVANTITGSVSGSSASCTGNAATASNATQFGGEANTNFMRGLAGGTEANINNYTDNGFRSVAYTGHGKALLSFSVGSSIGTVQQEYFYNIPANGWRVRNKTDSTTWSSWGNVVMTDTNQGALTGTVITTGNSSGLSPTFTNLNAAVFYDSNNTAYYIDAASTSNVNNLTAAGTLTVTNIAKNSTSPIVINSGLSASLGLRVYYDMNLYNTLTFTDSAWNSQGSIFGSSSVVTINAATATTSFVKYAGYSQEGGSFRAPIFYDSDNTAYYIDAAGTSSLNNLNLAGYVDVGTYIYLRNNLRMLNSAANGWLETIVRNSGSPYFQNSIDGGTFLASDVSENNNWLFQEAVRGWGIFYLNKGTQSGQTFGSYTTIGAETFIIGQGTGTNMTSTWTGYNASSKVAIMLSNYSGYIWANDTIFSATGLRAPIFYDSNDTTYYVDPHSLSNIRHTIFHVGSNLVGATGVGVLFDGNYTSGQYRHRFRKYDDGNGLPLYVDYAHATANSFTAIARFGGGGSYNPFSVYGTADASGDFRAPIFYDSNDTTYYIDPANGGFNLRGGNSNRVTFNSGDGGIIVTNAEGVSSNVRLGCAWGRPGIYNGSSITVGAETTIDFVIANAVKAYIDSSSNLFSNGSVRSPIFYDSNNTAFYTDPASTSVLNRLTIDGGNYAFDYFQSLSDFTSGTLVTTDIPATAAEGESFVMNVVGKSYSASASPFNFTVQGYLYSSTIINFSGIKLDSTGLTSVKIFENGGVLCFWWPTISYWNAFEVSVRAYNSAKNNYNRVTNITNSTEPTGTKKVTVTLQSFLRADVSATNSVDLRAPIFYDSNNTAFYCDPTATSNFTGLTVANTITGSVSGNAATATNAVNLSTNRTNWSTNGTITAVVGQLAWKHYNNNHTIIDASNSTAPDGTAISNTNPGTAWSGTYPTLMGWNGSSTYGVRVDSSRYADQVSYSPNRTDSTTYPILWGAGTSYTLAYSCASVYIQSSTGNIYANGFYDAGNTAYYVDPASTSNLNAITAAGNVTAAQYYTGGWFRNSGSGNGLYNEATGEHFYSDAADMWNVASANNTQGIRLRTGGHNGTIRGYFYANNSNDVGLLNQDGNWRVRVVGGDYVLFDGSSVRAQIFYDSNDTNYYCNPASNSVLNGLYANSYNNLVNDFKDVYVYGDVNTYYVVLIQGEYIYSFGRYSVTRGYNWTGPDTWNIASHKGGLTLDWEWSGDTAWGGNDKSIRIIEFNETYSTMVGGLGYPVNGGVIIWLRGGGVNGAQYRIRTPIGSNSTVTIYDGVTAANHSSSTTFTAADSTVFSTRANTNNVSSEILARYPVRGAATLNNEGNGVLDQGSTSQSKSGILSSSASLRAPIFYDTDNTGYYLDAAGTSNLNALILAGSSYFRPQTWIQMDGSYGMYWPNTNGCHIEGNTLSSYGSLAIRGTRGGWKGIHFYEGGNVPHLMFDGSANGGVYFETGGRWASYYSYGNNCWGFGTSTTNSAYNVYAPTGLYSGGRVDGTIFYDTNNTALYCDPNGTSLFTGLTVTNTITGSITGNAGGSSASCTGNAATATILQTARNINGTSFNGSAAITTATWGTARTITIGSTGKSVDGSANVSWSLAELGAAATNQTMFIGTTSVAINRASASLSLTGVSIDGSAASATIATSLNSSNSIARTGTSGNYNTDFQNTPAGTVRHQGDDSNATNNPGGTWWFVDNYRHSNGSNYWGTQVAWGWEDQANKLATRNITANSFGSWVYYLNSGNYSSYAIARGGDTLDGVIYFRSNKGAASTVGANNSYSLEAYSSDAGAAGMSFHRGGYYAVNMGLDPDNVFRIGGWSASANRLQLDMSGNLTLAGVVDATQFRDSSNTAFYVDPASTSVLNVVTANQYVSKSATQSLTGTTACTIDVAAAGVHVLSLASGTTISSFTYNNRNNNPSVNTIMLVIKYAGTASISWTNVLWANGVTPSLTATNGFADVFTLTSYQGGAGTPSWIGSVVGLAYVSTTL